MAWVREHQGMLIPSLSNLQSHIWALVWGLRTCLFSRQRYTKWSHPSCGTLCLKSKLKSNMISRVFPVVMYGSESWTIKKAECQRIDAFKLWCWRRLLTVPLDCKEIQPVHPKGNQPWIFIGRTDAGAEAPILWPPDAKSQLIGKDPDIGKDWRQEGKGTTEDKMVGWHHRLDGHKFEQALGDGEGHGSLVCCSPWGRKELDTTEWMNNKLRFQEPLYSY